MNPQLKSEAEGAWLIVKQVMEFERISRMEAHRRTKPGDPHFLISKPREDGKAGLLIHARTMTPDAQDRWRQDVLRKAGHCSENRPEEAPGGSPKWCNTTSQGNGQGAAQLGLYEQTAVDRQIKALSIPMSERGLVVRRYKLVEVCLNHDWKAQGYASKRDFMEGLAKQSETSVRSIQRWITSWKQRENLLDLINDRPGPAPGSGAILEADMRAHLRDCWTIKKLTLIQCYRSLVSYLEAKQSSSGCRVDHHYPIPSRATVERFIRSLDSLDQAARQSPDALKIACGYMDRTYRDAYSLDRVEVDEWKCDFFCYIPNRPRVVKRFWLLTFYDARSMFPLVWRLVEGDKFDNRHGIKEEDEIGLLVRLLRGFGVPGALASDRGRFRGGTFGGNDRFKESDGILDRLGIVHHLPREKNPRGARLERFHRFLADCSRTVPGWIGANDKEREMTPGDDQAAVHQRWLAGDATVLASPLLSTAQAILMIDKWMEQWRDHASEGTDMDGLSPRAVFQHNIPAGGFRTVTDAEIDLNTAEHFRNWMIRDGGVVQLSDGKRYFDPQLLPIQGERREVTRSRWNHEQIVVHGSAKGEEAIVANRRVRVGLNDPDQLSRSSELQAGLRRKIGEMVSPMEYDPGAPQFLAVRPQPEAPEPAPVTSGEPSHISSSEWMMQGNRYQRHENRETWDFADLEK